jgi:polysaccharide biosynthesis protein PslA
MAHSAEKMFSDAIPTPVTAPRKGKLRLSSEVIAGASRILDFGIVVVSGALAFILYIGPASGDLRFSPYMLTAALGAALFVAGCHVNGGYVFKHLSAFGWQAARVAAIWLGTAAGLLMLAFIGKISEQYSRGWAMTWGAVAFGLLVAERGVLSAAIRRWSRQGYFARNVVVVGAGEPGERLIAKLRSTPREHLVIIGVFDDRLTRVPQSVGGYDVLGTTSDLLTFARQVPIDEIIVALPLMAEQRLKEIFDTLKMLPVDLRLSAEALTGAFPVLGVSHLADVPVLEIVERPLKHWSAVSKWVEDKLLAGLLFVLLAPAMGVIALLIRLDSPGPVFFVQERFGFNNRTVRILKFRTMYVDQGDPSGAQRTLRNDPRVTRVGRILRAFSLDELPQLLNVLRGEMSLVGPRAHAVSMKAGDRLYYHAVKDYLHRHRVKPGITGWAQIHGLRGEIDTLDKARTRVAYDLEYIDRWSLWLDLKILLMSFRILLSRENAY